MWEGTGITTGDIAMNIMATRNSLPLPPLTTMTRILVMSKLYKNPSQKSREEGLGQQGDGEVLPWRALPRGPLLDPSTNIIVSSWPHRRDPLRGPQSAPPTNSRVRSCSFQPASQGPNTPCPLVSVRRDKSRQFWLGNRHHTISPKRSCRWFVLALFASTEILGVHQRHFTWNRE